MNRWKVSFFVLAAAVLLTISLAFFWLNSISSDNSESTFERPDISAQDGAEFRVSTSIEDLNTWIAQEMAREGEEDFDLYVDDAVYVEANIDAFGFQVPMEMQLNPVLLDNGNIELQEESFQIATIDLPSKQLFQVIGQTVELPEWITVVPDEQLFYVDLRSSAGEEADIRVVTFDLEDEDIEIAVTLTGEGEPLFTDDEPAS
ncbi:YpmS family protein [Salisediminibacterium halotolerans]|uniref:Uncharacterized protein YpmS n=1 Tax=Salisediminibacterium halotolerans TaxID=517425 RepID=A0A1H9TGW7_9BACI|nr:YpmS family protein [Salisediminibacterium haloalkalitolerans]SER96391.1 Uncharacterized protein YpmS [Salisediminibacterium haloalkalitolerans]